MKVDIEETWEYIDAIFTIDGKRFELAAAHALNWLTGGLAAGAVVNISSKDTTDMVLLIITFIAFLFAAFIRYYTLGIEEHVKERRE